MIELILEFHASYYISITFRNNYYLIRFKERE
jgi:hypothetical protein